MSSKERTTSVKLGHELREKLYGLARLRHRSAHSIMKEAIARHVLREEMAAWQEYFAENRKVAPELAVHVGFLPPERTGLPDHVTAQIAAGHNRLRIIRGWRGMTQTKLAEELVALGVFATETTIEMLEENEARPDAGLAAALARILNVEPEDVAG